MRMLSLLLGVTILTGCTGNPVSESTPATQSASVQSSLSAPPSSTAPTQSNDRQDFANRMTFAPSSSWTVDFKASMTMRFQFNQGKKCKPGECPQLVLYTEDYSLWGSWFNKDKKYVAFGPCNPASAYGTPEPLPSGDITVGGVKAEYHESAACRAGDTARSTWLFREHKVVILGFPTARSEADRGYLPYAEFRGFLETVTWK